jgi:diguanylate cyclase (GGDEF)-like protein
MRASSLRSALNPLVLQIAGTALAGALIVGTVIFASRTQQESSKSASDRSNAALLAADIRALVDGVELLRLDLTATEEADAQRISLAQAIEAHDGLLLAHEHAEALHLLIGSGATLQIWGATGEAVSALELYLQSETAAAFDELSIRLEALAALTAEQGPLLGAAAQRDQQNLQDVAGATRLVVALIAALSVLSVTALTLVIGRRLQRALDQAKHEKASLVETSRAMARRNEQFTALYQIVSEVTETLSLKYIAGTTIREARHLVGADVSTLRLLQNDELVVVGTEQDDDADAAGLRTLPLGTGIVGRAAKRGKTVRIEEDAQSGMSDGERIPGIQSGIVVPLIIGARVVGTLGCWSRIPRMFSDDDERILEMMASQVATAIAAANVHEATARDAQHDALTSLPNRRSLNEDLRGALLEATLGTAPMALVMVDIDHFKRLNDEYGHRVGDITLQGVADVLRTSVRAQDIVYRYGGEEFLIVFMDVDAHNAAARAEHLRAQIERMPVPIEHAETAAPVTISIGVAIFPDHGRHLEALIDIADRAMYASKEAGRNCVTLADEDGKLLHLPRPGRTAAA